MHRLQFDVLTTSHTLKSLHNATTIFSHKVALTKRKLLYDIVRLTWCRSRCFQYNGGTKAGDSMKYDHWRGAVDSFLYDDLLFFVLSVE